jgi:hypothetical protein
MISERKCRFVIVPILICIFMPVLAAEPNESNGPKTELKFETSIEIKAWTIAVGKTEEGKPKYFTNPGPVKPSYVAKVMLHDDYPRSNSATGVMNRILESPIAKKFSKEQQQFFKTELAVRLDEPERIPFYYSTWLYATSEEDAKLMAQAYIDGLNRLADQNLSRCKQRLSEHQQKFDKEQKELSEKQSQLKIIEKEYETRKETTHRFSSGSEAADLAKKSIIEMDKTLNSLDIELAGIREKLKAIEKYRNEPDYHAEMYIRLDEMYIELMIEMSGLEARRKITEQIREKQQVFLSVYNRLINLRSEVSSLEKSINIGKGSIDDIKNDLKIPRPWLQPPKVYQNTVMIYPVLTEN